MFIDLTKNEIVYFYYIKKVNFISLWTDINDAKLYYSSKKGVYTGFTENKLNLDCAYSTPVKIYKFSNYSSNALEIL